MSHKTIFFDTSGILSGHQTHFSKIYARSCVTGKKIKKSTLNGNLLTCHPTIKNTYLGHSPFIFDKKITKLGICPVIRDCYSILYRKVPKFGHLYPNSDTVPKFGQYSIFCVKHPSHFYPPNDNC